MFTHEAAGHSVLVVDDEPQVLTALKDLLEGEYTVFVESNPLSALALLDDEPNISVIISDQRMPDMAGDEFLMKARTISAATRLLLTGYADMSAVIRAINQGQIFGYISKPWDASQLTIAVHKATEHFSMTRELERERALLHNLMDSLPDAVFFKDAAHRYLKVNRAAAAMIGVGEPLFAIGKTAAAFLCAERAAELEAQEDDIRRTGQPLIDQVERVVSPDGVERWVSRTMAPIIDDRGQTTSFVGVARDISERERARQALLESEERHRSLYSRTPAMMQSTDRVGRLISVSDLWCETLGYLRAEVLGRPSAEFMTPASRLLLQDTIMPDCLRVGGVKEVECQFLRADGRVVETLLSAIAEFGEAREIMRLLFILNDVTEKKALHSQLLQAQKMEAIGHLTGGIAHDFNNLLTVILGNLDFLDEGLVGDEKLRPCAEAATRAAVRGADLTHRLLAFSRRQVLEPTMVDLNVTVEGLTEMVARTLGAPIAVHTILEPDLWLARIDPAQLESSLLNLCVNARDAMPKGGTLTISTANFIVAASAEKPSSNAKPGAYVRLAVSDTGSGIPPEHLDRVFEPFFTTKPVGKGTGLGLSMVHGFVAQSDGFVEIVSKPNEGTSIRLHFPRLESAPIVARTGGATMAEPQGSETILLVDDERDVRETAVNMLKSLGYKVLIAENAFDALQILDKATGIDLLFTDMIMPGDMTGAELAAKGQALMPGLKVLYTSGYAGPVWSGDGDGSLDQWLPKPYRRSQLAKRVRSVLDA